MTHAKLMRGEILSTGEAATFMQEVMLGKVSEVRLAAALAALSARTETAEEIAGFARAMREHSVKVAVQPRDVLLDIVGTGGDGANTFNISTTTAFLVASGGVAVAKHGNRAASSRSGSADVLEALGVRLDTPSEVVAEAIDTLGIGFIFARNHHPALRYAAPVRTELGARTVFNILGPLSNPAGASHLLIGVFDKNLVDKMTEVLRLMNIKSASVVYGDGLDELSVCGENVVSELHEGSVNKSTLSPANLGIPTYSRQEIAGGTPSENAEITKAVLSGSGSSAQQDIVALNAALAFKVAGKVTTIHDGITLARQLMKDGAGWNLLQRYALLTQK